MIVDFRKYALFAYEQAPPEPMDEFVLGHVVINELNEIGVIIQKHKQHEYRTDMFGNCCESEIREASFAEIKKWRPKLIENSKKHVKLPNIVMQSPLVRYCNFEDSSYINLIRIKKPYANGYTHAIRETTNNIMLKSRMFKGYSAAKTEFDRMVAIESANTPIRNLNITGN